jgi:DNA-binding NtrC family response regulator
MDARESARHSYVNGYLTRRILLAESDPLRRDLFPQVLMEIIPGLSVEVCSSKDEAHSRIEGTFYQAVVGQAQFASMDGCALLKYHRSVQPHTPFLVTVNGPSDRSAGQQALHGGAFDVLTHPVDAKEVLEAVQPALWLYQLSVGIHRRQERVKRLREQLAHSAMSSASKEQFANRYRDIEQTYEVCQRAIKQIESSLKYLQTVTTQIETEARERAIRALDALP